MAIPGSNIRLLRRQMGLSQQALADAAEIDLASLSRLENGKGGYTHASILRIAHSLGVSLEVLFSEPEKVEAAALRMREAPVLSAAQLAEWRGVDSIEMSRDQEYLYGDPRYLSRHVFGWRVLDSANAPVLLPNDLLMFDANKPPEMGSLVIAQTGEGTVYIGRFKRLPDSGDNPMFEVIPYDPIYEGAGTPSRPDLELRGTLVEYRRRV